MDVFTELTTNVVAELAEAEIALCQAELDVAAAKDAQDVARLVRSELTVALGKLDPDGPTAARLRARIHAQRQVEDGVTVLPAGVLENARLRVANLRAEVEEIERATAPAPVTATVAEEENVYGEW
jgi:hypothetical protein